MTLCTRLRTAAALAAMLLVAACAVPVTPPITGYTCCNLRPEAGWISSNNIQGTAILAAGEPVRLDSIKRSYYFYGTIGGRDIALRDDSAKTRQEAERWARSLVVADDPRVMLATWSPHVQIAVRSGKVLTGMTRAQVLMSLGHPSRADTPNLDADTWRYWTAAEDTPVDLSFEQDTLMRLTGTESAVRTLDGGR